MWRSVTAPLQKYMVDATKYMAQAANNLPKKKMLYFAHSVKTYCIFKGQNQLS